MPALGPSLSLLAQAAPDDADRGQIEAAQADDAPGGYFAEGSDTWYLSRLCGTFKEREQWHPCQLPEALLSRIINASSNEGDLVFDPFAGSGTTLSAANKLGRDWLGCEMSTDYRERALKRINNPDARKGEPVVTKAGKTAGVKRKTS